MLRSLAIIMLAILSAGCGSGSDDCKNLCNEVVAGLPDANVDCSEEKWQSISIGEECLYSLEQDLGTSIADPGSLCQKHFGKCFISGAERDVCLANVPVCQTTAGCALDETKYIEGSFPGFVNFAVTTQADTTITVKLLFATRKHPGEDTEISWYEPGCHDAYTYESMGADIFAMAGADQVFIQEQKVLQEGLHLVDVYSDATTHYYLRIELQ